jgi:hypothetical protein
MARITGDAQVRVDARCEVFIVAPRNGVASGQIIVSSDTPLTSLTVMASDFAGKIPAPQVRYGLLTSRTPGYFDGLAEKFEPGQTTQPVWLTVRVPANTPSGEYAGRVTVAGQAVPVKLKVTAFTLPDRKDYTTWVSATQSPETLALHYKVPVHSDAHWKLIERSLELQGQLADKVCYVPVIGRTWFGNEFGMVQFRRQGGALVPDFSVFERYLALYVKHCGPPRAVILNLWEPYMAEHKDEAARGKVWLTVVNATSQREVVEMPRYPEQPALWQAVVTGAAAVVKKAGLPAEVLRLGISSDSQINEADVSFFKGLAPDLPWAVFTHGYGGPSKHVPWTYGEFPDNGVAQQPIRGGWDGNPKPIIVNTARDRHNDNDAPVVFRGIADIAVGVHRGRKSVGLARLGLDLWPVADAAGKSSRLIGRFPENRANRLYRHATYAVTVPGPNGALATQRFEMLREGIQDAEARIVVERALKVGTLPEAVKARAEKVLLDRAALLDTLRNTTLPDNGYGLVEQLLDLAGAVARQ